MYIYIHTLTYISIYFYDDVLICSLLCLYPCEVGFTSSHFMIKGQGSTEKQLGWVKGIAANRDGSGVS